MCSVHNKIFIFSFRLALNYTFVAIVVYVKIKMKRCEQVKKKISILKKNVLEIYLFNFSKQKRNVNTYKNTLKMSRENEIMVYILFSWLYQTLLTKNLDEFKFIDTFLKLKML